MTTRRKFLTTSGILAGLGIFGKLFSQKTEQPKSFKQYCEDQVNNDIQGSIWQDEIDRSKEFEGMGEFITRERPPVYNATRDYHKAIDEYFKKYPDYKLGNDIRINY